MLRDRVDCQKTITNPSTQCDENGQTKIELVDRRNKVLVADPHTPIGQFNVEAFCDSKGSDSGIKVIAYRARGTQFLQDPITKELHDKNWKQGKLFPDNARLCGDTFNPNTIEPCSGEGCTVVVAKPNYLLLRGDLVWNGDTATDCGTLNKVSDSIRRRIYIGKLTCPDGFYAAGGGSGCIMSGGDLGHSMPMPDGKSWRAMCCYYVAPGTTPTTDVGGMYTTCVKEE